MKYTLLFFCTLSVLTLTGQTVPKGFEPGHITLKNGVRKTGWVHLDDHIVSTRTCYFIIAPGVPEQIFSAAELADYGIDGKKYFRVFEIAPDPLLPAELTRTFVECLIRGRVSLYFYDDRYFMVSGDRIEELKVVKREIKHQGNTYTVDDPVYRTVLRQEMSDCKETVEYLEQTELTQVSLSRYFGRYYECVHATYETFGSGQIDGLDAQWTLMVGPSFTSLNLNGKGQFAYMNGMDPARSVSGVISFNVEFSRPGVAGYVKLRTGITTYLRSHYVFATENTASGSSHNLEMDILRIEIPVHIKFYPIRDSPLYAYAGIGLSVVSSRDHLTSTLSSGAPGIDVENAFTGQGLLNVMVGMGTEFSIARKRFSAELGYAAGNTKFKALDESSSASGVMQTIHLALGYRF